MKALAISISVLVIATSFSAFAQGKTPPPASDQDTLSDKAAEQRADDVSEWDQVNKKMKKKKTNKIYQEPFGPIDTPPAGDGVEIDNPPQDDNYDSSPFDRN